jgi:hypothetical protein
MRGVLLGITLEEFRNVPVPSDGTKSDLRALCSDEYLASGHDIWDARSEDLKSGIVSCNWYGADKSTGIDDALYIALGDGAGFPVFDFIESGAVKRLFQIRFYAKPDYSAAISRGLTDRYGIPVTTVAKMQLTNGNTVEATTLIWANAVSSITFESPCRRVDRYCLTYYHREPRQSLRSNPR